MFNRGLLFICHMRYHIIILALLQFHSGMIAFICQYYQGIFFFQL